MFWVCDVFFREIGFANFFVKLISRKNNNKILLSLKLWINLIFLSQFFFYGCDEFLEDIGFVLFAFFNVIWATLYLESWKRKSSELAYTWCTADQRDELLVEPRPQFKVWFHSTLKVSWYVLFSSNHNIHKSSCDLCF